VVGLVICLIMLILFIIPLVNKKTGYDVYIIWGVYFLSTFLSFFFDPKSFDGFKSAESYSNLHFILYGLLICYSLSPLYVIKERDKRPLLNYFKFSFKHNNIINILIVGNIFAIVYMLPYAIKSMALGATEIRNQVLVLEETFVLPPTILTTIAVAFSTFFSVYIGLFYLSLKSNLTKSKKIFLFIISFSYVVNSLCFTGRDGLIFYLLLTIIFITNYWGIFSRLERKRIYLLGFIVGGLGLFILTKITNERFEDSSNGTMGYIATQPYVFAENIDKRNSFANGFFYGTSVRFPLVNNLTGQKVVEYDREEQYEWTFGTFLTDFYSINGLVTMLLLLVFFIEFFKYYLRKSYNMPLRFMLTYVFYIHFIISGLFYFKLGTFSGNIYILVLMILIMITRR